MSDNWFIAVNEAIKNRCDESHVDSEMLTVECTDDDIKWLLNWAIEKSKSTPVDKQYYNQRRKRYEQGGVDSYGRGRGRGSRGG